MDHCRNPETGEIEGWARDIISRLNSYTEISPSGCGVHILVNGKLPPGDRRRKGKIEMYSEGRYFTMTGHHLEDTPSTIEDRQTELADLHQEIFGQKKAIPKPPGPSTDIDPSDQGLIDKAHQAANGQKFARLWQGDTTGYETASEATAALIKMLVFWCGPDQERIDRLFRQSGLIREKWDRRQSGSTWGRLEIERAIAGTTEFYTPGRWVQPLARAPFSRSRSRSRPAPDFKSGLVRFQRPPASPFLASWCNRSIPGFDPDGLGANPSEAANHLRSVVK